MKVLVTRAASQLDSLTLPLRHMGLAPVALPCIEILPPLDWTAADSALRRLEDFTWAVWTSANGVHASFERLHVLGLSFQQPEALRVASVGPSTSDELKMHGWSSDFMPSEYASEALGEQMEVGVSDRVLLLRGDRATFKLPEILRARDAAVTEAIVYRTSDVSQEHLTRQLLEMARDGLPEILTFASPSAVKSLHAAATCAGLENWFLATRAYALGPITAKALLELGTSDVHVPEENSIESLLELLRQREAPVGC